MTKSLILFKSTLYKANNPVKILIHGFGGSYQDQEFNKMKDEILKKENVNVFIIDWKVGAAQPNYLTAQANAKTCGTKVGEFLANNRINSKLIHCIGIKFLIF